jgi:hypothetical protein
MARSGILLCWTGVGRVSYGDQNDKADFSKSFMMIRNVNQIGWFAIIAVIAFGFFYALSDPKPIARYVDAPAYAWPKGCSKILISTSAKPIPCECADEKYRIPNPNQIGLIKMGRGPAKFYRIDDDAVQISFRNQKKCILEIMYKNTFRSR